MMNEKFLQNWLVLVVGSTTFLISSCASVPITNRVPDGGLENVLREKENANAQRYNMDLAEAIEKADKIVIKEHSHRVDFMGTAMENRSSSQYLYAQRELSPEAKAVFLGNVRGLKGEAKNNDSDCMFESHHTIDFYEQGQLKSSMEICYECTEVKWNGTSLDASQDVFKALSRAIFSAGMNTHRDWDAMAKNRYEAERASKPPVVNPRIQGPPTAKWATGQIGKKVINPFTGKLVDVEGIPANTKVRDPNDDDTSHVFRVPDL